MSDDLDVELPDLRVGVLAARTFLVREGRFRPVGYVSQAGLTQAATTWTTADAVARCFFPAKTKPCECGCGQLVFLDHRINDSTPFCQHEAPADGCECGLYSFTTAQEVFEQYRGQGAYRVLAVLSLEGHAIEGSRGWRSEKARIIAAWVRDDEDRAELSANYPTVRFYSDGAKLLADYPAVDNGTSGGQYPPQAPPPDVWVHHFVPQIIQSVSSSVGGILAQLSQMGSALQSTGIAFRSFNSAFSLPAWRQYGQVVPDEGSLTLEQRVEWVLANNDFTAGFFLGSDKRDASPFLDCTPPVLAAGELPAVETDWAAVAAAVAANPAPSYAERNSRRLDGTNQKGGSRRG